MNRREFIATTATLAATPWTFAADTLRSTPPARTKPPTKTIAVVASTYYYLSHAYHICGRFLNGYMKGKEYHYPDFGIRTMYVEQVGDNDISREMIKKHNLIASPTIEHALTAGTNDLVVDGVLLICEHGNYPYNAKGQKLYPRHDYFRQIVDVFKKTNKTIPVFCDKHLSYDRKHGFAMVETSKKMGFPLYAGSSLPITWRRPEVEIPLGTKMTEAVVASRGELEIFGIHSLESLQCMVERRTNGDQGVKAVTCLEGDAVWKAGDDRLWSWDLLQHALGRSPSRNVGDIKENCRHFRPASTLGAKSTSPLAFIVEYRDGFKGTVLVLSGHVDDTTIAVKLADEVKPVSTMFYLPPPPGAAFLEALSTHVETFLTTKQTPYPIERTMLTGGILDWCLESRLQKKRLETPDLEVSYAPPKDSGFMRGDYTNPVE